MDKESAIAAQKKANGLIPKVGYPLAPNTLDPYSLKSWYSQLDIVDDDFFGNVVRSTLTQRARDWGTLGKTRDRDTWEVSRHPSESELY
jgi:endothelin-converting enzyme